MSTPPPAPLSPSVEPPLVSLGQVIAGRYTIQSLLGSGGMGQVFRALEEDIEREVALKFIRLDPALPQAERDAAFERLRHEAQALGSLPPHPNRVVLYQYGKQDGLHYMAMELVRGVSLSEVVAEGLGAPQILSYARQMASALVDVHASGIVHRDIKPENLIVTRSLLGDELLKLIDFGIARGRAPVQALPDDEDEDREILGTALYMAPELLTDGIEDPRTDVYALGVILYELVTGKNPFAHAMPPGGEQDLMALVRHHVQTEPAPVEPREDLKNLPRGLGALILRCLAKDPERRFADARALLQALEQLEAPPSSQASAQASGAWRATGPDLQAVRIKLQRDPEPTRADVRLVPSEDDGAEVVTTTICGATRVVATADLAGDVRAWHYDTGREILFLAASDGKESTNATRTRLAFLPGGRSMALGDRAGRLWLVDVEQRTQERIPLTRGAPVALGFDQSASLMVVATTAETLELWDIPQRKHLATLSLELPSTDPAERGAARALALSAQRAFLAAGTDTGLVHLWNFKDRAKSGPLAAPPPVPGEVRKTASGVSHLEFNPAESRLALLRESGALEIWDPVRRVQLHRVQLPEAEPRRLRYSPDGVHLLIAYNSGGVVSVDAQTGTVLDTIRVPRGRAVNVDYTADGVPVASLARGSTVQVWDLLRLGRVATLGAFPTRLLDVTIARYGETALTLAAGGYVDQWDLCTGRHLGRQRLLTHAPREMHKAPEEHRVLVCGPRDGLLAYEGFQHNSTTPLEPVPLPVPRPGRAEQVVTYSVSPDRRLVALAYSTGDARLYGYQSASDPQVLPGTGAALTTVCFSPDQQYLVTGDAEGRLRLWDPVVGRVEWEDQSARLPIHMVAFTPSGRLLSVPRGNVIEVWNVEHRRRVARLEGHEAPIRTLVHGLEGRLLLSSSDDGTARMWDMAQQRSLRVLGDHPGPVTAATFDASLRLLLTTSGPYLSIWRVADAALLARCSYLGQREGTRHARWVSFTPDGAYTASERAPLGVEFTRPGTRVRTSDAERDALFDPRAVVRRLLGE